MKFYKKKNENLQGFIRFYHQFLEMLGNFTKKLKCYKILQNLRTFYKILQTFYKM